MTARVLVFVVGGVASAAQEGDVEVEIIDYDNIKDRDDPPAELSKGMAALARRSGAKDDEGPYWVEIV